MTRTFFNNKIRLTFRHKWDDKCKNDPLNRDFKSWEIGIFFEKNKALKKITPNLNDSFKEFDLTLINDYKIGCGLLICKFWFNFNSGDVLIKPKKDKTICEEFSDRIDNLFI